MIKIKKPRENLAFEFTGKNNKKIITSSLCSKMEGQYKNDLIRLKITSENKSANTNLLMTPYEAMIIANGLHQAILFHKESIKRFLK